MKETILTKIRNALSNGPAAKEECNAPLLDNIRLFTAELTSDQMVNLFKERGESSGAKVYILDDVSKLAETIERIAADKSRFAVSDAEKIDKMIGGDIVDVLNALGQVMRTPEMSEDELYDAEVGITGADLAIAETGSLVLRANDQMQRTASLVTSIHIAIIQREQIVPDLMDFNAAISKVYGGRLPGAITIITGPSKTADIEMNLVVGVHGPSQVHVIVLP